MRTCYISAPARVDTSVIRRVLRRHGLAARDAMDIRPGDSLAERLEDEITRADLVVAVFSGDYSPGVAYEAGLAQGLGKPVVVVTSEPMESPLSPLSRAPIVLADSTNEDALSFALDQILPRLDQIPSERRSVTRRGKRRPDVLAALASRINRLRHSGTGRQLERLLAEALRSDPAVSVAAERKARDAGIDMALWLDGYGAVLGNPLLVEVKIGSLSDGRLLQAESQLAGHLFRTNARFGLLVYLDRQDRRFLRRGGLPIIVRMDAVDLVRGLEKSPLGKVLRAERNRIAHGRSS